MSGGLYWSFVLGAATVSLLAGLIYLTVCVGRFQGIRKLSGGSGGRRFLLSLGIIAAVFALLAFAMSMINAVVVFLHAVLIFLLFGLGVRLAGKLTGRQFRANWQGWLALAFTLVYLTGAYISCNHVRQKDYVLTTEKRLGTLKIALIADSHLGTTFDGDGFGEHLKQIEAQSPDLLVITGDFVDDWSRREDLEKACAALGETKFPFGVWYVYGNHDAGSFSHRDFSLSELEEALRSCGVHVLADQWEEVDGRFIVAGRKDASMSAFRGSRKDASDLLAGADGDKYIVLLDHQPSDYDSEALSPADLVLSGHTHGGQLIPITYVGKWFGIVDREYGYERREGTDFIVTSGISDWALQFKTGARSEYVLITVEGKT